MSFCKIILDNNSHRFLPFQTVTGRVECHFENDKKVRGVKLKFNGEANTSWTERQRRGKHTHTVTYWATENYFSHEINLLTGGDEVNLAAGAHVYQFAYKLPARLPSSFESSIGNVRYLVKAVVDRPWKFDYEDEIGFEIGAYVDLNKDLNNRREGNVLQDKTICCCCCRSGPIVAEARIPVQGYTPGQTITCHMKVENLSNASISHVKYRIIATKKYASHHPKQKLKYDTELIVRHGSGGIGAHGEHSWNTDITIPPNYYLADLSCCSIINISYLLKVTLVLPFPHRNLHLAIPINIGNVPLQSFDNILPPAFPNAPNIAPTAPPNDAAPLLYNSAPPGVLPGWNIPNIAPPSYEEVCEGKKPQE